MKYTILLALALAFISPLQAAPKDPAKAAAPKDPAKAAAAQEKAFARKDKDGDKSLSKEEFTAGAKDQAKAETAFSKKDKNADGKLSMEEFTGKQAAPPAKGGKAGKGGKKAKPADGGADKPAEPEKKAE